MTSSEDVQARGLVDYLDAMRLCGCFQMNEAPYVRLILRLFPYVSFTNGSAGVPNVEET